MFAGKRRNLTFQLKEGQQVVVKGSIEVYERDGRYQLYASEITLDGTGDLFKRFEKLRNELEEMGMFAPEYKQPIPAYASRVGIVTALTGAAIRDIINIATRRNPYVQLVLCPALVQGDGAAASIVRGIRRLDAMGLDVLIVGRGGGAIEDLWAFNEEEVARAIFACRTPVISAVGHETDVTIADYAADLRAPTPSAAAELAVFDYSLFVEQLQGAESRLFKALYQRKERASQRLLQYGLRLRLFSPGRRLNERRQRLADMEGELMYRHDLTGAVGLWLPDRRGREKDYLRVGCKRRGHGADPGVGRADHGKGAGDYQGRCAGDTAGRDLLMK